MNDLDFERDIASVLHIIGRAANRCRMDALAAIGAVRNLPARPAFITKAEESLERAENEIWHALQAIRRARASYEAVLIQQERSEQCRTLEKSSAARPSRRRT